MEWTNKIEAAAQRIAGHVRVTPVLQTAGFGLDRPLEFKLEQTQHTGSFKARGAFNTLLSTPVPTAGIVAASGGNHGAAVGYAAAQLGHPATIFVPEIAGPSKLALIERTGADLRVVKGAYAEALAEARAFEEQTGAGQVHAYDAIPTVEGQGTVMREWEAQGLQADTVLIAVGGGGLVAGAMAWLQGRRKIVAVEPERCAALYQARKTGAPLDVDVSGVAANALGARRIGQICFDLAQAQDLTCVTVTDDAILHAQTALWQELRQLVEPAGAAALAALMSGAYTPEPGERVAILVCGGNIAPDPLA
ncbi:threonine/serine dehydratase [Aliishimia ponticola]|uniref:Threonine/serine dehydratase n=1 Tax=Aliishimia ponticola TaxID=2499833 RepID=A0A4S4N824_9RHOB|nr:threonine/serine dehydratase [Aliishimia ponticola]THH35344.1 threonine/serine dehydratase [Aliishimia ponticola]